MTRYGIDIDGVLRDFDFQCGRVLLAHAPAPFPNLAQVDYRLLEPAGHWYEKRDLVGPVNWSWFWDEAIYDHQVFVNAPLYEQHVLDLDRLQGEVFLITSQPPKVRPQTYAWLARHGINVEGVLHVSEPGEKREFINALQLDYFVDDHPRTVFDLINAGVEAKCYVFDQPWNQDVKAPRIKSLKELLP